MDKWIELDLNNYLSKHRGAKTLNLTGACIYYSEEAPLKLPAMKTISHLRDVKSDSGAYVLLSNTVAIYCDGGPIDDVIDEAESKSYFDLPAISVGELADGWGIMMANDFGFVLEPKGLDSFGSPFNASFVLLERLKRACRKSSILAVVYNSEKETFKKERSVSMAETQEESIQSRVNEPEFDLYSELDKKFMELYGKK